jgi:hypothetical protein
MSTTLTRGAVVGAVLTSVIALSDAAWQATSDEPAPWAPGEGIEWISRTADAVHGLTYALLAAALVHCAGRIDAGRAAVRWLRRIIVVDLALLAVPFFVSASTGVVGGDGPLSTVSGIVFLALFLLAFALGVVLVARRETRHLPAWVLVSTLPVIGLTVLAGAVGWAHPGYVETAVYVGLALLGAVSHPEVERRMGEPAVAVPAH